MADTTETDELVALFRRVLEQEGRGIVEEWLRLLEATPKIEHVVPEPAQENYISKSEGAVFAALFRLTPTIQRESEAMVFFFRDGTAQFRHPGRFSSTHIPEETGFVCSSWTEAYERILRHIEENVLVEEPPEQQA